MLRQVEDRIKLKVQTVNLENLAERIEAIEIIYNMHEGQNVMLDTLQERLNDHTIEHKKVQHKLGERLTQVEELLQDLKITSQTSQTGSEKVGKEMLNFRKDLDKYYDFLESQCKLTQEMVLTS